jgi:hypothetical protein
LPINYTIQSRDYKPEHANILCKSICLTGIFRLQAFNDMLSPLLHCYRCLFWVGSGSFPLIISMLEIDSAVPEFVCGPLSELAHIIFSYNRVDKNTAPELPRWWIIKIEIPEFPQCLIVASV